MADDNVDLRMLGANVRAMQRDVAALKAANEAMRAELAKLPSLAEMQAVVSTLDEQIETRFDRLDARQDQTERSIEERLTRIERLLEGLAR